MTIVELVDEIRKFNSDRDWDQFHTPKNLCMALSIEVSEVMEYFQWLTLEESMTLSKDKINEISEEMGDVLIYFLNLADKLGIDPIEAAKAKMDKNKDKYPILKSRGKALKYTDITDK